LKRTALLLLLLLACAKRESPRGAWVRHDLWTLPVRVEPTTEGAEPPAKVEVPMAVEAEEPNGVEPGRIRGLRVGAGTSLVYQVTLGTDAFFSFVPLRPGSEGCRHRYMVSVRDGDRWSEVAGIMPAEGAAAPETAYASLTRWSGRTIDLALRVERRGDRCAGATLDSPVWGSPAVYSRCTDCDQPAKRDKRNVILISFDAMRADAVGAHDGRPSLTPAIDRLAARSDVWTDVYATFNVTNPSFASTMTGLYGPRHGVYDLNTPLPYSFTTLAEVLRANGYRTGAIVSAQHLSDDNSGLGQGFEDYQVAPRRFGAEMAADMAMEWLAATPAPQFLWLHFFDPHTPHDAPRPYATGHRPDAPSGLAPPKAWRTFRAPGEVAYRDPQLRAHEDLYDAEVAYVDRQVDRLLDFLDSRGLLERSIVVLMSDHGENGVSDRVPFRHAGLWDATTRIPLIIHRPGAGGRTHHGFAQNVDIFPTLLSLLGVAAPPTDGRDLLRSEPRAFVVAEHAHGTGAMWRDEHYLYNWSKGNAFLPDGEMLFDVRTDPEQRVNLATQRPEITAAYVAKLRDWRERTTAK
jgi:arylsulfatase A-like enzyme